MFRFLLSVAKGSKKKKNKELSFCILPLIRNIIHHISNIIHHLILCKRVFFRFAGPVTDKVLGLRRT